MKRHFRLVASALCAAVLLSACGGGTSSFEAFQPGRVLAFGDEISTLAADGRKYALNALKADGSIDCEGNPLWIQSVANLYGFRFAQCLGAATEAKAITRAAPGANVADVTAQIDAQVAAGIRDKDLALVLVGLNDVRQIYEGRAAGEPEDLLLARARERGILAGAQVNRLVSLGARVIVATAPDLGITPYGQAKGAADAALLTRLSAAFNGRIRVTILNDGRFVGLVLADEMLQTAVTVPSAYGLADAITPACRSTHPLPNCNADAASLVEGASATAWLWADDLRFGTIGQLQLGSIAASRAQLNPF